MSELSGLHLNIENNMQPLSKRKRSISWGILFLIFLLVSPLILYRSFGYRLDDLRGVVKSGGIYVHSDLANTEIFVDGEYFKNNGVLIKNTLIQDLDPDIEHKVELRKAGYHDWNKILMVKEGLVTESASMMIPKEIETVEVLPYVDSKGVATTTASIAGVKLAKNAQFVQFERLFLPAATTTVSTKGVANTKLATTTKEIPEYFADLGIVDPDKLKNLIVRGEEVSWIENGNVLINWIGERDSTPFYYCFISDCVDKKTLDWQEEITRFDFLPNKNHILIVMNTKGIWAVEIDDRSERNIQPVFLGEKLDFRINDNNRITVLQNGIFHELRM